VTDGERAAGGGEESADGRALKILWRRSTARREAVRGVSYRVDVGKSVERSRVGRWRRVGRLGSEESVLPCGSCLYGVWFSSSAHYNRNVRPRSMFSQIAMKSLRSESPASRDAETEFRLRPAVCAGGSDIGDRDL